MPEWPSGCNAGRGTLWYDAGARTTARTARGVDLATTREPIREMIDTLPEDLLDDVSAAIAAAPASRHHRSMAEQENAMQPDREDELSTLRDIARRASVLVRWFSRDDAPWVGLSAQQRAALDRDAETLTDALHRAGHYVEGWGN